MCDDQEVFFLDLNFTLLPLGLEHCCLRLKPIRKELYRFLYISFVQMKCLPTW